MIAAVLEQVGEPISIQDVPTPSVSRRDHRRTAFGLKLFSLCTSLSGLLLAGCTDQSITSAGLSAGSINLDRTNPTFSFSTIDVPSSLSTSPQGINAGGAIVGGYTDANKVQHAFLLENGVFATIDYPGAGRTTARGIGPSGEIVGSYGPAGAPTVVAHGFRRSSDGAFNTADYPGHLHTIPQRILADGTILGCRHDNDQMNTMKGIMMSAASNTEIGAFASMNNGATPDRRRIVGLYFNEISNRNEGYIIDDGVFAPLVAPGATVSAGTQAWDVNPRGDVAGFFSDQAGVHGFVYMNDDLTIVNFPGATATRVFGINARGDLVGTYGVSGTTHGFLARRVR